MTTLLRGEVWDVNFPRIGRHPAVVLMINPFSARLSGVTVALVTGTEGPDATHVPLGPEVGLTRYDESYAVATDLHTIPHSKFQRRRGLLSQAELDRLGHAVRLSLGLL